MSAACFQTSSGDLGRQSPPFHVMESNDASSSELWQGPAKKRLDVAFICPAAGCGRRVDLRLPALPSTRILQFTRGRGRPCSKTTRGKAPSAPGLGARHSQRRRRQAEVDALARAICGGGGAEVRAAWKRFSLSRLSR